MRNIGGPGISLYAKGHFRAAPNESYVGYRAVSELRNAVHLTTYSPQYFVRRAIVFWLFTIRWSLSMALAPVQLSVNPRS